MYHYLCMTKYYDGLINLELTFYNILDNTVKKIHVSFVKANWPKALLILNKHLPQF